MRQIKDTGWKRRGGRIIEKFYIKRGIKLKIKLFIRRKTCHLGRKEEAIRGWSRNTRGIVEKSHIKMFTRRRREDLTM